jgi:hypothetical protein
MTDGAPPDAAEIEYFDRVEQHFARLRGSPLLLSPKDWALVAAWREAGIPLRVVLETLDHVFRSRDKAEPGRPVLSLSYCKHAVQEAFEVWREGQLGAPSRGASAVGSGAEPGLDDTACCLRRWADELRGAADDPDLSQDALRTAGEGLDHLARKLEGSEPPSLAAVEEDLEQLEDRLLDALLAHLEAAAQQELEQAVVKELGHLESRLTERAYRSTFQMHLRAGLRARHSLPRLTLYPI